MKTPVIVLAFAAVLIAIVGAGVAALGPARAQGGLAAPANVLADDGDGAGEVIVSWGTVADAEFYRIGWVSYDIFTAVQEGGRPWLDAFAFTDVTNYGQDSHTLTDLAPGVRYAFIIGSVSSRFGAASWSEWAHLTLAEAPDTSCPTYGGGPTSPPFTPTPRPTAMPTLLYLPCIIIGKVTIGGQTAPEGTVVQARSAGQSTVQAQTNEEGVYQLEIYYSGVVFDLYISGVDTGVDTDRTTRGCLQLKNLSQ